MSMSTRCQDRCPAVEKPASLQQAPGGLHDETWAGRVGNLSLSISQLVEIMPGCADMVTRLLPPLFSSMSPGPGREVRNGIGWSLLEKTARSGVWLFQGALSGSSAFFAFAAFCQLGSERIVSYSMGTIREAVLATARRFVEGSRSPNEALVC